MDIEGVTTQPDPYARYLLSQAIKSGPFVFVSGQAGYDDDGKIVEGDFAVQGEQAFQNLKRALTAAGGIDKLTYRRGLALPDRGLNALYVDASAHSECVLTSKDA